MDDGRRGLDGKHATRKQRNLLGAISESEEASGMLARSIASRSLAIFHLLMRGILLQVAQAVNK
jgi:hypothetical protein